MDWLFAALLPDVSVALGGVIDGDMIIRVRIIGVDGEVTYYDAHVPLEDVKAMLKEVLHATTK